jgi:hypothetical protein
MMQANLPEHKNQCLPYINKILNIDIQHGLQIKLEKNIFKAHAHVHPREE